MRGVLPTRVAPFDLNKWKREQHGLWKTLTPLHKPHASNPCDATPGARPATEWGGIGPHGAARQSVRWMESSAGGARRVGWRQASN